MLDRTRNSALFVLLASILIATEIMVVNASVTMQDTTLLSLGVTLDLLVGLPLLYYLLVIRKSERKTKALIPVFFLSLMLAYYILPKDMESYLGYIEYILLPLEVIFMAKLVFSAKQIRTRYLQLQDDLPYLPQVTRLERAILDSVGDVLVIRIIVSELMMFYYLIVRWWRNGPALEDSLPITYHRRDNGGVMLLVFTLLGTVEMVVVHILIVVLTGREAAAWIVTFLSIYSLFWLAGDYLATKYRPIWITPQGLVLEIGIRWSVVVDYDLIKKIKLFETIHKEISYHKLSAKRKPNIFIQLHEEIEIRGLFGTTRHNDALGLYVDEQELFLRNSRRYQSTYQ